MAEAKQKHLFKYFLNRSTYPSQFSQPNLAFTTPTTNSSKEPLCLCQELKWIWLLSQLYGLNPLSIKCTANSQSPSSSIIRPKLEQNAIKCRLEKVKLSLPFITALFCLVVFGVVGCLLREIVDPVIKSLFTGGTDAYASKIHISIRIVQTIFVALCGLIYNRHLVRAWASMQHVIRVLNHHFPPNFKRVVKFLTIVSIILGLSNLIYVVFVGVKKYLDGQLLGEIGLFRCIVFVWTLASSEYSHLALSSLLFAISLAVQSLQKGVAKLVENTLQISYSMNEEILGFERETEDIRSHEIQVEIERLRLLYQRLCETIIHLRRFFGVSCLFICIDGILTIVFGIYWRIIYYENLTDEYGDEVDVYHVILFSLHLFFSLYSLLLIVISGQILATSTLETPKAISNSRICHLNSSARFQISLLLQVSSGFPTKFSVYSITNLEMRFLATAAINVITYLLVLMQFRLEQTNQKI